MNIEAIQAALREQRLDGWLFYDHHNRDPLAYRILGLGGMACTRRWYYLVPAKGSRGSWCIGLRREAGFAAGDEGGIFVVAGAGAAAGEDARGQKRMAMQYSPRNAIMYISMVDAGTVELLRGMGKEIVSSADLVSQFEAVLTEAQIATHFVAQRKIDAILEAGWKEMGRRVRGAGDGRVCHGGVTSARRWSARVWCGSMGRM